MSGSGSERAPSQPTASTIANLFSLPLEIRNKIYKRVLTVAHPLRLFQDPGCPVEAFVPEKPYRWLSLLYTNKQISYEARAVLYGTNRYILEEVEIAQYESSLLESFINCIGPVNAGLLSHLCINFPSTEKTDGQSGKIRLREASLRRFQLLQKECSNLRILEAHICDQKSSDLIKEDLNDAKPVRELLLEINAQFRGIASLNKIILRVYSGTPSLSVKEVLQGLGWIVLIGDR